MSFKVLVSDPLAKEGVDILKGFCDVDEKADLSEDELVKIIGEYDALIVRSGTQVTARIIEAADKMKYIGRAVLSPTLQKATRSRQRNTPSP